MVFISKDYFDWLILPQGVLVGSSFINMVGSGFGFHNLVSIDQSDNIILKYQYIEKKKINSYVGTGSGSGFFSKVGS